MQRPPAGRLRVGRTKPQRPTQSSFRGRIPVVSFVSRPILGAACPLPDCASAPLQTCLPPYLPPYLPPCLPTSLPTHLLTYLPTFPPSLPAFSVCPQYHLNRMYGEAINTYGLIVKNKQYPQAGRLRINMGNIHFEERKYGQVRGAGGSGAVSVWLGQSRVARAVASRACRMLCTWAWFCFPRRRSDRCRWTSNGTAALCDVRSPARRLLPQTLCPAAGRPPLTSPLAPRTHTHTHTTPQAIKMYRMALDQIPPATSRDLRLKIQRNIGHALVRQGQFQDAITAFESIMEAAPGEQLAALQCAAVELRVER